MRCDAQLQRRTLLVGWSDPAAALDRGVGLRGYSPEELDSVQVFFEPKHYVRLISNPVMAFIVCMCSGSRGISFLGRRNGETQSWHNGHAGVKSIAATVVQGAFWPRRYVNCIVRYV